MEELTTEEINALRVILNKYIKGHQDRTVNYKKLLKISNKLYLAEISGSIQVSGR